MRDALVSSGSHLPAVDREQQRVAQVVTHFCVATLLLMATAIALARLFPSLHLRGDAMLMAGAPPFLLPLLLLRLGQVRAAGVLAWSLAWFIVTALSLTNGGLSAPAAVHYLMLMLTTALISQGRTLWLAFSVATLSIVGLGALGAVGWLPPPAAPAGHAARGIAMTMALLWLALMLRTTLGQLRDALRRAEAEIERRRRTEFELREADAKLRALNEQLEARVAERTAELSAAKEAALSASHAKSDFLATMSHELRTPIAGIIGLAELLARCELPPEARSMLEPLTSSSKTLLSLIGDVLDYSKIEAGRLDIERIVMAVRPVIQDVLLLLRPKAEEQGLRLELNIDPSVPPHVRCDPTRVQQIVLNLVSNAIKFTPSGRVSVQLGYRDGMLSIAVRDTGIGISPDAQAGLFQPFSQADRSTTRKYGGSGLGLVITRRLAHLLGGDVSVVSEAGVGSTFTCTVQAESAEPPKSSTQPSEATAPPLRVLLAEDNDINAFILSKLLAHLGHTCERVRDGREAVKLARQRTFDAIIMDMQMPILDGGEATRQIRQLPGPPGKVPIIGLSADAISDHNQDYMACGLNLYLTKPCTLEQLQRALVQVSSATATAA